MSRAVHRFQHVLVLHCSLCENALGIVLLLHLLHFLFILPFSLHKLFYFFFDVNQTEFHSFCLSSLEDSFDFDVISFLFESIELVASLFVIVVGAIEEFAFDEVQVYLLVFVLSLLLDSRVAG